MTTDLDRQVEDALRKAEAIISQRTSVQRRTEDRPALSFKSVYASSFDQTMALLGQPRGGTHLQTKSASVEILSFEC